MLMHVSIRRVWQYCMCGSGDPLISETDSTGRSDTAINDDDSEVVAMIKELLETRIRPAVMEDGGDIVFQVWQPRSHAHVMQTHTAYCISCCEPVFSGGYGWQACMSVS